MPDPHDDALPWHRWGTAKMPGMAFARIGTPCMPYILAEFSGEHAACDADALRAAWEDQP